MTDIELDEVLDRWQSPDPPPSLRLSLQAQFPRDDERRSFAAPIRWILVLAATSAVFAFAVVQSNDGLVARGISHAAQKVFDFLEPGIEGFAAIKVCSIVRLSNPKVYVDGVPAPPPTFGIAAVIDVQIPGEGVVSLLSFNDLVRVTEAKNSKAFHDWYEAGRVHGNRIEFEINGKQVVIECSRTISNSDRPVFIHPKR